MAQYREYTDEENLEILKRGSLHFPPESESKEIIFEGKKPRFIDRATGTIAVLDQPVGDPVVEVAGYVDKNAQLAILQQSGEQLEAYRKKMFPASYYGNEEKEDLAPLDPVGIYPEELDILDAQAATISRLEAEHEDLLSRARAYAETHNLTTGDIYYDKESKRFYHKTESKIEDQPVVTPSVDGGTEGAGIGSDIK